MIGAIETGVNHLVTETVANSGTAGVTTIEADHHLLTDTDRGAARVIETPMVRIFVECAMTSISKVNIQ